MSAETNWSGNIEYSATRISRPTTIEELQETVAGADKVSALGSRHSFNGIADTTGVLVGLQDLDPEIAIDDAAQTVRMSGGVRYGELGAALQAAGYGLGNLASLPHISVAGAVSTATHGSGVTSKNLAGAVAALDLVTADGTIVSLDRSQPDFFGAVVGVGALGVVSSITLEIEPTYDVAVSTFEDLAWDVLIENFDDVMSSAYSVSAFTNFANPSVDQIWLKQRTNEALLKPNDDFYGARPSVERRHPLPGIPAVACNEQLGIPGAWIDRLPHFRLDFTPSNGAEIQSEYLLPREHAPAAIQALRGISAVIAPLIQIAEIRTIAADELWLSTAYEQDSVALHFTWLLQQQSVNDVLPVLEAALAPFQARPHWGKAFLTGADDLFRRYQKMPEFRDLAARFDPNRKFGNAFLERHVYGG